MTRTTWIFLALLLAATSCRSEDRDADGYDETVDCDDMNNQVHPSADEYNDGIDNDCDGSVDEEDRDADGYDETADCDDMNNQIHPGAVEYCDGIDNDCDGSVDEADALEQLRHDDEILRKKVQGDNPLPSEIEATATAEQHRDMIYVPGGTFVRGRLSAECLDVASSSEPLRKVVRVDAFYIDRFEFPNVQGEMPAMRVTWEKAAQACVNQGKRLCSDWEWEKACKGAGNMIYAYGDDFDSVPCGSEVSDSYSIGSRSECVSGYGVHDMSGGVREWTSSAAGAKGGRRLVKGALLGNPARGSRCAFAVDEHPAFSDASQGFRCCLNADGSNTAPTAAELVPEAPPPAGTPAL